MLREFLYQATSGEQPSNLLDPLQMVFVLTCPPAGGAVSNSKAY